VTGTTETKPGLRERKKQRTHETIIRVALELFAKRGYQQTTLADIAEAADISPRTIFGYFESKEAILFAEDSAYYAGLKRKLDERPAGATTFDAFRAHLLERWPPDRVARLRSRVINSDATLRAHRRARSAPTEQLLAESIAKDLGTAPDDIRATMISASVIAAFLAVSESLATDRDEAVASDEALLRFDDALQFLRGGLEAVRRAR
jgi:AcrR family transcriptional regulator